jgi:protoheme IX farnesyltransferase
MKIPCTSYLELCKIKIALLSAGSAAVGFLLSASELRPEILMVIGGVFFLACGLLVLNQCQDRDLDAAMPRTSGRPIPSGRITPVHALYLSFLLLISGFSALLLTGSLPALALGLFAVAWYNGVYAFLKRKSAFAVVPGALTGAVPPAIGWIAGGGALRDPRLLAICFFFFLWQVPHSWLLMTYYGREYEKAGLPTPAGIFSPAQLQRIIVNWIFATSVSCLFLSVIGVVHSLLSNVALFALSLWLIGNFLNPWLRNSAAYASLPLFRQTNYYLIAVLLLISADKLFVVSLVTPK